MKLREIAIVVFVLATFTYAGCNKIEEALDVTFDVTFATDLDIDIPAESRDVNEGGQFEVYKELDPASLSSQFNEYKDKLKSATTKRIVLTVTSISEEPVNLTEPLLSFWTDYRPDIENLGIYHYYLDDMTISNGYSVTIEESDFSAINEILQGSSEIFIVSLHGNTDVSPVQFTFKVEIDAEIVANPL